MPRDLAAASEAFVSSSVAGILPVTRFGFATSAPDGPDRGPAAPEDREAFIRDGVPA